MDSGEGRMSCEKCRDIHEVTDRPHVVRPCPGCGRELHIAEPGEGGKGIKVKKGDKFVIPPGFIRLSLDPRKSSGRLYRGGIQFVAETLLVDGLFSQTTDIQSELQKMLDTADAVLRNSPKLTDFAFDSVTAVTDIHNRLESDRYSEEWWDFLTAVFASAGIEACSGPDVIDAVWRSVCAERARIMLLFKQHLEEVVWMGQGVSRILEGLATWDGNRENSDEAFWQKTLTENSYILNQVFAAPLIFIQQKAYVGGMNIKGSGASYVDYLLAFEGSQSSIMIEIKTPTVRLLGKKYRQNYSPSSDLTGSLIQILDYRDKLVANFDSATRGTEHKFTRISPRCAIIIGNAEQELNSEEKRKAFELFRASQRDVEIVSYDELFKKVELPAELFHLKRTR